MPRRRIVRKHKKDVEQRNKQIELNIDDDEDEFTQENGDEDTADGNPKEKKRRRTLAKMNNTETIVSFPRIKSIPQHLNREKWMKNHETSSNSSASDYVSSLHPNNAAELVTARKYQIFLLRNLTRKSKFNYDSTLLLHRNEYPNYNKKVKLVKEMVPDDNEKPHQVFRDRNKIGKELFDLLIEFGYTADAKLFNLGARTLEPRSWDVGSWTFTMLSDQLHKYSIKSSGSKQEKMLRLLQFMKKMKIRPKRKEKVILKRYSQLQSKLCLVKKNGEGKEKPTEDEEDEEMEEIVEQTMKEEENVVAFNESIEEQVEEEKISSLNVFSTFMRNIRNANSQDMKILQNCIEFVFEKFYKYQFRNSQLYCQYVMFFLPEFSKLECIGDLLPNLVSTFELAWNIKAEEQGKERNTDFTQKVNRNKMLEFLLENFRLSDTKILSIENQFSTFSKYEKLECEKLYKFMLKEDFSEGIMYCCNQYFTFLFVKDVISNLS